MITLSTAHAELSLDPDHGAEIVSIARIAGTNVLAHHADWIEPARSRDGAQYGNDVTSWLSNYRGGWQELFPNNGKASAASGMPFNGEASTAGWALRYHTASECTVEFTTRESLTLSRRVTLHPDRPTVTVTEKVRNIGDTLQRFAWGHHPVFPLHHGAAIDLPVCSTGLDTGSLPFDPPVQESWPRLGETDLSRVDTSVPHRLTFHHGLRRGWAAYRPPPSSGADGVAMSWDVGTWPSVWLWTHYRGQGFPWFGRAQFVGIEPHSSWPNDGIDGAICRGQHLSLGPSRTRSTWLTVTILDDDLEIPIRGVDRAGRITRARTKIGS